jgi:hypothetical protein
MPVEPILGGEADVARDRASREVKEALAVYVAKWIGDVGSCSVDFWACSSAWPVLGEPGKILRHRKQRANVRDGILISGRL